MSKWKQSANRSENLNTVINMKPCLQKNLDK